MKHRPWSKERGARVAGLILAACLACGCAAVPAPSTGLPTPVPRTRPLPQPAAQQRRPLAVQADPAGATVMIDGVLRGASPLTVTLPAGDHVLGLRAEGFEPLTETLTLVAGQEGIYSPSLSALAVRTALSTTEAPAAPAAGAAAPTRTPEPAASPTARPPTPTATSEPATTSAPPAAAAAAPTPVPTPASLPAAGPATVLRIGEISIPTYPYTPYLRSAIDATAGEYPVLTLDRAAYEASAPRPVPVTYTLVVLENRYLRLSILPELGGRVYECVFKPTGNDEFYRNPVIKPTSWGPPSPPSPRGANWWLAVGGLEWGFPVEEHGYEWATQWGYEPAELPDGSAMVTVFTGDFTRPYVAVQITLPPAAAYFTVRPAITNPNAAPFRFKWWATAMLAPGAANKPSADLRFIFPVSQVTVHSTGDASLPAAGQPMSWPVVNGRDLSRLGNWSQYLGIFERPAAAGNYMGVYDPSADEGMLRIYPSDVVRGAKIFASGWKNPLDSSQWTDDGSGYVELHGGLAPTFDDWAELAPGDEVTWSETWYPVAGIGGVTYANGNGALALVPGNGRLKVSLFPTAAVRGRLTLSLPGAEAIVRDVTLDPAQPLVQEIVLPGSVPAQGEVSLSLTSVQGEVVLAWRGTMGLR